MSDVLIIIPAYNEESNIERVVDHLVQNFPQYDYVIVNDGSKDRTGEICRERGYNFLDLPVNLGLAGAFQAGIRYAYRKGYECAIQLDGDGQHRPDFVGDMKKKMDEGAKPSESGEKKGAGFNFKMKDIGNFTQMLGGFTVLRLTSMLGMVNVSFTNEEILNFNAQLNKIKKPKK